MTGPLPLDIAAQLPIAHFTPAELPGSLAIFVCGIGVGFAVAMRGWRVALAPLALMACLATLGMLADSSGWPAGLRVAIDACFLLAGLLLVRALWWRHPLPER